MSVIATSELDEERVPAQLAASMGYCARLTRQAAKNFYYGLKLLPHEKRAAMFALYAYMRRIDDIADDDDGRSVEQRVHDLNEWRKRTHAVLSGAAGMNDDAPIWPAFAHIARRYDLPVALFDEAIAGQQQDLSPVNFENFQQLHNYCYRVAGVVGLASIKIWGYEGGAETEAMAVARGVAFQITNILRDLREDAARGRLYLPREDLDAAGLTAEELRNGDNPDGFNRLMRQQINRIESFYEQSAELESRLEVDSRPTMIAMTEIYRGLLTKIARDPRRVLRERVSLSLIHKLRIGWRATRAMRQAARA
ncbi:MAG TPA: phytoene/squalene synthase family protein [Tepidisphaeraceae bacterium]|jgi:phytoene synthase|nr:phytoene/squalene synthase family protein [Tepidisphaeraceae bacterium]